jgi:hypothetical protein
VVVVRPLRIEYEGAFYEVMFRANERRKVFFGKVDYEQFETYRKEEKDKYGYLAGGYRGKECFTIGMVTETWQST